MLINYILEKADNFCFLNSFFELSETFSIFRMHWTNYPFFIKHKKQFWFFSKQSENSANHDRGKKYAHIP